MRLHHVVCGILLAVIIAVAAPIQAADFEQLFKAVDQLELNLKKLVEAEKAERQQSIKELKAQIANLPAAPSSESGTDPRITKLAEHVKKLSEQVAELAANRTPVTSQGTGVSEETVLELVNDIAYLKSENQYLRNLIEENNTQLASLDGGGFMPSSDADRQQVAELTARLGELNNRLAEYVAGRHSTEPVDNHGAAEFGGFSLNGFVDAAHVAEYNSGESEFGVHQIEVDVINQFNDRAALQADIEMLDDHHGGFNFNIEQGFLWYRTGSATSFTFGKFNAPIGFEGADPVDMYQFSGGLSGTYGLPADLTGLMFTAEFGIAEWATYVVNGWDINADNNKEKTFGTRLGITPAPIFTFGMAAISGAELDGNNSSRRTVADIDWLLTPSEHLFFGGEFLYGVETKVLPGDEDASFFGGLIMSHITFGHRYGLTGRVSYFSDEDGVRTGHAQKLTEFTISPSMEIIHGFEGLFEVRYDMSSEDTFEDGDGGHTDSQVTTALEFIYGF